MSDERGREGQKVQVLDHGYVQRIETWGSDERIIESARMSTDKGFLGWGLLGYRCPEHGEHKEVCCEGGRRIEGDEKLLQFLSDNHHDTPFEFGGLVIEVQAPIMVYREWHRHRTQSYNEMSARYIQMPNLHYVPSAQRIIESSAKSANKQASGGGVLKMPDSSMTQEDVARIVRVVIEKEQHGIYDHYEQLLSYGVSKEIARINTPVARYSRMRASSCLRNWIAFLTLRKDRNAQWEIRQFADQVGKLIQQAFPRTWEIFSLGHPGSWDDDGFPFYDHQIASLEKKLATMKARRTELEKRP